MHIILGAYLTWHFFLRKFCDRVRVAVRSAPQPAAPAMTKATLMAAIPKSIKLVTLRKFSEAPLIKPLTVGNKTFPTNLIQGPLAGVSCAPFRLLTWRYGHPAFSCTEMISCKSLLHRSQIAYRRYIAKHPEEGPVCFQLFGNNPKELATATKIATDAGADLIDLNCGCPVKKVRNQGAGSGALENPVLLCKLIRAMKQNTSLPVSVKIRVAAAVGTTNINTPDELERKRAQAEQDNLAIVHAIRDGGADFVVVHGRHWTEHYDVPCRYDAIRFFVEQLQLRQNDGESIPVIGNGDVACAESLRKMLATGCAGAMIGRAGVGQPWLISKLTAELRGEEFIPPAPPEIAAMFIEQVCMLSELLDNEKAAILQARKLANRYARNLPQRAEFSIAMNSCDNLPDLIRLCRTYFI
jgi:tRNA-dihydrouridine synthase B